MSAAEPSEATGDELKARSDAARAGGSAKYAEKLRQEHKLPVRRRLELLLDPDYLIEDGLLAHSEEPGYGADGVVTVIGRIEGRTVCVMANDPTVKAGSWGPRTVEKIVRIQETAQRLRVPIFYLVDSAGARITDQVQMFPGRRHAGRIFYQEVRLSGVVPQICLLFGPSAAGGAYIPAFCDITIMVEGNASMYLGSPRMAEMVIGEKVTLEEMGGARMHSTVSGLSDLLVASDEDAIAAGRRYLSYFPQNWTEMPRPVPSVDARPPGSTGHARPRRRGASVQHAAAGRWGDRRGQLLRGQVPLREGDHLRPRAPRRPGGRRRREPTDAQGRHPLRRLRRQGGALHLALRCVQHPAALSRRRPRLHDRHRRRAPGDHPPRREDDRCRLGGDRAEDLGDRAQGVRRGTLCHGRSRLRAQRDAGAANGHDRRDGTERRGQRRFLQQDPGAPRSRPSGVRQEAAGRVSRGHRSLPAGVGPDRRRRRAPAELRTELANRFAAYATSQRPRV